VVQKNRNKDVKRRKKQCQKSIKSSGSETVLLFADTIYGRSKNNGEQKSCNKRSIHRNEQYQEKTVDD
jgi:hypothetical protein